MRDTKVRTRCGLARVWETVKGIPENRTCKASSFFFPFQIQIKSKWAPLPPSAAAALSSPSSSFLSLLPSFPSLLIHSPVIFPICLLPSSSLFPVVSSSLYLYFVIILLSVFLFLFSLFLLFYSPFFIPFLSMHLLPLASFFSCWPISLPLPPSSPHRLGNGEKTRASPLQLYLHPSLVPVLPPSSHLSLPSRSS